MKKHSHNDKPDNERPCAQDPELDAPQIIYGPPSAFGLIEEVPIEES